MSANVHPDRRQLLPAIPIVVAHTATTVYKLRREPFLAAVLGYAATGRKA